MAVTMLTRSSLAGMALRRGQTSRVQVIGNAMDAWLMLVLICVPQIAA